MRQKALLFPLGVALITLAVFVVTQLRYTNGVLGAPLDDAWIHFQYARNLSQGSGFSFNLGVPTAGSTAPLWTLLLALPALFTEQLMLPALLISAFFLLLSVVATFQLGSIVSDSPFLPLMAATLVALTGRMVWAGWSGMEATAFTAISTFFIYDHTKKGMRPINVVLLGLTSQLRPEAHALFAIAGTLWFFEAIQHKKPLRETTRKAITFLAIYALIAAPYMLFSLSTTGKPLPNTFYAKSSSGLSFSVRTLRETLALHFWDNPLVFIFIPFGLFPLWQKSRLATLWLIGLPLFTAIIVEQVWHHGRYTLPLVPLQMVAGTLGLLWLARQIFQKRAAALSTVRRLLFAVLLFTGAWQAQPWAQMLATNTQEILAVDVAIGEWLAVSTPEDALIAVDDIGAIAYLSERKILDLNGLVSPEMWPALRGEPFGLGRNQEMLRLLSEMQPDYVAIFPTWHFELAANREVLEPVARFSAETHTILYNPEAIIYRPNWPYFPTTQPDITTEAIFGDAIGLDGYTLSQHENRLDVTLYWRSIAEVVQDYDIFIHLSGEDGQPVAQTDGQPLNFLAPTSRWRVGDTLRDERTVALDGVAAGRYQLNIGIYQRETFARLPLNSGGEVLFLQAVELP